MNLRHCSKNQFLSLTLTMLQTGHQLRLYSLPSTSITGLANMQHPRIVHLEHNCCCHKAQKMFTYNTLPVGGGTVTNVGYEPSNSEITQTPKGSIVPPCVQQRKTSAFTPQLSRSLSSQLAQLTTQVGVISPRKCMVHTHTLNDC